MHIDDAYCRLTMHIDDAAANTHRRRFLCLSIDRVSERMHARTYIDQASYIYYVPAAVTACVVSRHATNGWFFHRTGIARRLETVNALLPNRTDDNPYYDVTRNAFSPLNYAMVVVYAGLASV